jgi:hypothetical protein
MHELILKQSLCAVLCCVCVCVCVLPPPTDTTNPTRSTDSAEFDGAFRLPAPGELLTNNVAYFWTNGLTNFDMVNLLAVG